MRVVLSTYGSRGDFEPMAALAVELRALGANVSLCAPPDREFVDLADGAGVPMVPFDRPWRSWVRPSTPTQRTERVAEFIAAQYNTVAEAAHGCDVLVSTAMSHFIAQSVAEQLDIPHRHAVFAPNVLDDPDAEHWNALFGPWINAHRESIGLSPVDDVGEFLFGDQPWLAADRTLGPWEGPAAVGVIQTGAWILSDDRALPSDLEAFLDAGSPPVYVGFGSMRTVSQEYARAAVEGARARGCRTVLARGWAELALPHSRDDCFTVGEVNQQALFGRVAAVVHHGGAGTTTTAALAGAPQVVVPQAGGDQPYWAARVADLGIGVAHEGPTLTAESLSAALHQALTPETRSRAIDVAATVGTDGASVAAKLLEQELVTADRVGRGRGLVVHRQHPAYRRELG
jgi:vancomycin aglycone glucosyltransferase